MSDYNPKQDKKDFEERILNKNEICFNCGTFGLRPITDRNPFNVLYLECKFCGIKVRCKK